MRSNKTDQSGLVCPRIAEKRTESIKLGLDLDQSLVLEACSLLTKKESLHSPSILQKSNIQHAGLGLFANKDILKGEIISFYGGYFFPSPPLWTVSSSNGHPPLQVSDINNVQNTNDHYNTHVIHVDNNIGGYIDGFNWKESPLALAQFSNHPPLGLAPNAISISFYWRDIVSHLLTSNTHTSHDTTLVMDNINRIGNGPWYVNDLDNGNIVNLTKGCAPLAGVIFISCKDVIPKGEEILYDYNLQEWDALTGQRIAPSWYHKCSLK